MSQAQSKPRITQTEIATVAIGTFLGSVAMMMAGCSLGERMTGNKWGAVAGGAAAAVISGAATSAGATMIGKLSFRERLHQEQDAPDLRNNSLHL